MIPNTAHFVWFGEVFPAIYGLALRSAATHGGFEQVILHHEAPILETEGWRIAETAPAVRAARLDPEALFATVPDIGDALLGLFRSLAQPAALANMARVALLYHHGGVYLDTDVITLRPFGPLLDAAAFCGQERIVFSASLRRSRNPLSFITAGLRFAIRDACRQCPGGWRLFKRLERWYPAVVNNAVLGAASASNTMRLLLEAMAAMPDRRRQQRYALGTHLLEAIVAAQPERFTVHPPDRFFPLGPEISEHWFKPGGPDYRSLISPNTVCVHWYASVRTRDHVGQMTPEVIHENDEGRSICALLKSIWAPSGP